jgi:uncharacterized heparinase superfamily protein
LRRRAAAGGLDAGAAGAGAARDGGAFDAGAGRCQFDGGADQRRLGNGVAEVEVDRRTLEGEGTAGSWGATRLEASHDGYAARYGLIHRRILILRDDGTELRGEDLLVPQGARASAGWWAMPSVSTLGPGSMSACRRTSRVWAGAARWLLAVPRGSGEIAIEESIWADGQGRPVPVQQIVIQGMVSRGGGNFAWLLKKMG